MSWSTYRLGDIGEFKNGVNFSTDKMGRGYPLINVKDVTRSRLLKTELMDLVDVDISGTKQSYIAKEGDIFFVRSSVKREGVGMVGMLRDYDKEVIHCGFVIRFRTSKQDEIYPAFLMYLLASPYYREKVRGVSSGATITNVSQDSLKSITIEIPNNFVTQKKIASILSAYDDLIENNYKRIKLLEEAAQNIYKEWFVHFRFPDYESTEFERGLPKGWEKTTIGSYCNIRRGSSPRPINNQQYFDGGTIPWVKIADATVSRIYIYETKQHVNDFGASFSRKLPEGSLIIAASGTLGFPMFLGVEACIHDGWIYISELDKEYILFQYFTFRGLTDYFNGMSSGAAIQNINTGIVSNAPVNLSDKITVIKFNEIIIPIFKQIDNLLRQNMKLKEARDILLPRLMNRTIEV